MATSICHRRRSRAALILTASGCAGCRPRRWRIYRAARRRYARQPAGCSAKRRRRRLPATCGCWRLSPKDFLALIGGGQGRARAWRHAGRGRLLRPRRGSLSRPARCRRPAWARRWSPTAMPTARCPISPAPSSLARPRRCSAPTAASPTTCSASHAEAQADYRAALIGPDGDEARRRLALSLAITGDKAGALAMLGPLMARGDAAAARCRAFVLALAGDRDGARRSIDAAMPGSSAQMAPFFGQAAVASARTRRPPRSTSAFSRIQGTSYALRAAAARGDRCQLGPPRRAQSGYAALLDARIVAGGSRPDRLQCRRARCRCRGDRLASIDQLFDGPRLARRSRRSGRCRSPASRRNMRRARCRQPSTAASARPRVWVQLASGANAGRAARAVPAHQEPQSAMCSKGISGYVAGGARIARGC